MAQFSKGTQFSTSIKACENVSLVKVAVFGAYFCLLKNIM